MVNNTSGHVLSEVSELQLQHAWVNVCEQTVQLGKDSFMCVPCTGLSSQAGVYPSKGLLCPVSKLRGESSGDANKILEQCRHVNKVRMHQNLGSV